MPWTQTCQAHAVAVMRSLGLVLAGVLGLAVSPSSGHGGPRAQRRGRDGLCQLLASSARSDVQWVFRGAGTPAHLHDLGIPRGPRQREHSSPPPMAVMGLCCSHAHWPGPKHSAGHGRPALDGCRGAPFTHSPRVRRRPLLHADNVPPLSPSCSHAVRPMFRLCSPNDGLDDHNFSQVGYLRPPRHRCGPAPSVLK